MYISFYDVHCSGAWCILKLYRAKEEQQQDNDKQKCILKWREKKVVYIRGICNILKFTIMCLLSQRFYQLKG